MGIKDKWTEGVERTRQQTAAVEAARAEAVTAATQGRARDAWNAGSHCYVLTLRFELTKVDDAATAKMVDDVMAVGWRLHSTALTYVERTGFNNITCMFTFVR